MNKLIDLVKTWGRERGLDKASPAKQFLKVVEEVGEVAEALAKSQNEKLQDAIGDVLVTLIILAMQLGVNLEECLQVAYDEIKDRQGETVNGVYVKMEDIT